MGQSEEERQQNNEFARGIHFAVFWSWDGHSNALDKEEFNAQLQRTVDKEIANRQHILIRRDFNGRIGQEQRIAHGSMGNQGGEKTLVDA